MVSLSQWLLFCVLKLFPRDEDVFSQCYVRAQVRQPDCVTVFKDGMLQSRNFLHPQFLLPPHADLALVSTAHERV